MLDLWDTDNYEINDTQQACDAIRKLDEKENLLAAHEKHAAHENRTKKTTDVIKTRAFAIY